MDEGSFLPPPAVPPIGAQFPIPKRLREEVNLKSTEPPKKVSKSNKNEFSNAETCRREHEIREMFKNAALSLTSQIDEDEYETLLTSLRDECSHQYRDILEYYEHLVLSGMAQYPAEVYETEPEKRRREQRAEARRSLFDEASPFLKFLSGTKMEADFSTMAKWSRYHGRRVFFEEAEWDLPRTVQTSNFKKCFTPLDMHLFPVCPSNWKQAFSEVHDGQAKRAITARSRLSEYRVSKEKVSVRRLWKRLAKSEIPRQHRIVLSGSGMAQAKKLASLCQRDVRKKWLYVRRINKDAISRAKKISREILFSVRRTERELQDRHKKEEREMMEAKRREDELREEKRQRRKLNFLLDQTDIFAHFVAKKMGLEPRNSESTTGTGNESAVDDVADDEYGRVRAEEAAIEAMKAQEQKIKSFDVKAAKVFSASTDSLMTRDTRGSSTEESDVLESESSRLGDRCSSAVSIPGRNSSMKEESVAGSMERISSMASFANESRTNNRREELDIVAPVDVRTSFFKGELKEYQEKGVAWLISLYDQGINGILADEMGLGKTIQTINFLAYLAEMKGIWGPFLVIGPTGTLHNWQQEFTRFCPKFRVMPYWGDAKDRKVLRQSWKPRRLGVENSPFHVLITSYRLVVDDDKHFRRLHWQYLVLDEAHAIKSSRSMRWRTLLRFNCRNRLLLTGTPIQNNMGELWSLLHFIMPTLFDNHEEFSSWFAKDIESHAFGNQTEEKVSRKKTIDEVQLARLHTILKPFMLRRIKRDVERDMAPKEEIRVLCTPARRQEDLYRAIKSKISLSSICERYSRMVTDSGVKIHTQSAKDASHLMNIVMQLRKVCNHPDLFDHRDASSPFHLIDFTSRIVDESKEVSVGSGTSTGRSSVPKHPFIASVNRSVLEYLLPKVVFDELLLMYDRNLARCLKRFSIYDATHVLESSGFSFLSFIVPRLSLSEFVLLVTCPNIVKVAKLLCSWSRDKPYIHSVCRKSWDYGILLRADSCRVKGNISFDKQTRDMYEELFVSDTSRLRMARQLLRRFSGFSQPRCWSAAPDLVCSSSRYRNLRLRSVMQSNAENVFGIYEEAFAPHGLSVIRPPDVMKLIFDSGKVVALDRLLPKLRRDRHKALIFCQMTRMMDLLEDYLSFRKFRFLRMDGSHSAAERRDMVDDFQTRDDIFVFLLSTRAGGLGINLTAADTVIFYDHDWNPTSDEQAMDRCHRIGQTKKVTVYRIVVKGTIEEKILLRAEQKHIIQDTVYRGRFKADQAPVVTEQDLVSLLFEDVV